MTDAVAEFLEGKDTHASGLLREVRKLALHAGDDISERVSKSLIGWSGKRSFATAYVKGKYLELSIDLTRKVDHRRLRAAFATTKTVTTHRFTFGPDHKVDARIGALLKESLETVAPGARKSVANS
ncbi:hypothetical protein GCM10009422_00770 [Brevundimonas kwangchunensis]|uniref:DUF5655 domain-containing protein n=1 Tax=Brevundimonas kwangchunensis TaxID=322163 RepID=A0ABP3RLE1_9CAUL